MKQVVSAFFVGLIFAAGLAISGMTNPKNVIGFLDVTGIWKPALMFVMCGAILVYLIANFFIMKRPRPILDSKFHVPTNQIIDRKLILGSAVFGIGWGLGGYCPGPALTAAGTGSLDAILFVFLMFIGMYLSFERS